MVGFPKYKLGDVVSFNFNKKKLTGFVCIVDEFGTFYDDSEVSYDIMSTMPDEDKLCLYKHINEVGVEKGEFTNLSPIVVDELCKEFKQKEDFSLEV